MIRIRIIITTIYFISTAIFCSHVLAKNQIELLELPSVNSKLASQSVLMNMFANEDGIFTVGERGHIIKWTDDTNWFQYQSPVSVAITDIYSTSNQFRVAVGHDAVILINEKDDTNWHKAFDGYQLAALQIEKLNELIELQKAKIESIADEDERYDAEYRLEDLILGLEDALLEQQKGPNKPLLSVVVTSNNRIFAAGSYGILLQSDDKGKSWQLVSDKLDNPDNFHLNDTLTAPDGSLYIVGENGTGFYSRDNGESWVKMTLPYHGSFFGIITTPDNSLLVTFGLQGTIATSNDKGETWALVNSPSRVSLLGGTATNNDIWLVGHGGLVLNFPKNEPQKLSIRKHPSGAALAAVAVSNQDLILAGQFGISRWQLTK